MENDSYTGEERRKSHQHLNDRLVVVETKLAKLEDIDKTLKEISEELTKYKGMVGGILWVGSSLVALIMVFKDQVFRFLGIK